MMETGESKNQESSGMEGEDPKGEYQEQSHAVERARDLPGVRAAERIESGEREGAIALTFEDGTRLEVDTEDLITARHMNDHTLVAMLRSKYGNGESSGGKNDGHRASV